MAMKKINVVGTVSKKAVVMSAYCDVSRNQTIMQVHDEGDDGVYTLAIPTASERRLAFLTNGKKIAFESDLSVVSQYDDGRQYTTTYARNVKFM